MTIDSAILIPTLNLESLDLDELVESAWALLVTQVREPRDRECWELGYRMGVIGVLQPLVKKRLGF